MGEKPEVSRAPQRILLVEDEDDAREALARVLKQVGHECTAARSVEEALAAVTPNKFFDVIVSAVVLSPDGPDGIDLVGMLRERGIRAPVILVTAFADTTRLKRALNSGVNYLLEKPFRSKALLAVLDRLSGEPFDLAHFVARALSRAGLTEKEMDVARLLLKGLSNEEIAQATNNSDKTIRQHVTSIYRKFGVGSRAEFFHYVFPT